VYVKHVPQFEGRIDQVWMELPNDIAPTLELP
jgi:hypothetical protein